METEGTLFVVIEFLLVSICAGLLGTAAMASVMHMITRSGATNADMIGAIGSKFTGSTENAFLVGAILHFLSGVCFAMLYAIAFGIFGLEGRWPLLGTGLGLGFLHGFVLSFMLVTTVAEHHPMPEYREAGIGVAVAHLLGHIVYGGVVGLVVGWSGMILT